MSKYTFTGSEGRIMFGLIEAVNARTVRGNPDDVPGVDGSTVVLNPGDSLITDEPFEHHELGLVDAAVTVHQAPTQTAPVAPAPVVAPAPAPEPAPVADPAPVEPAPAPTV